MTIVELITEVGLENVGIQHLDECIVGATAKKRGGVEVRFITHSMSVKDAWTCEGERQALIVWLPRKKVAEAFRDGIKRGLE